MPEKLSWSQSSCGGGCQGYLLSPTLPKNLCSSEVSLVFLLHFCSIPNSSHYKGHGTETSAPAPSFELAGWVILCSFAFICPDSLLNPAYYLYISTWLSHCSSNTQTHVLVCSWQYPLTCGTWEAPAITACLWIHLLGLLYTGHAKFPFSLLLT